MNALWRAALPLVSLVWTILGAGRAMAAELRTETSARQVMVGEAFTVQLTATLSDGEPAAESPTLPVRGAAQVEGPSLFTQRRVVMHNFDVRTEKNVVATFQVTPSAKGRLVIGPGTFRLGNQLLRGERFEVDVVDGAPSRGSRRLRGRDPFGQDPFEALRQAAGVSGYADAPSDLALARAPDALGFLLARTDKSTAVVGEPVVLEIFAFGSHGPFREFSPSEPQLADFLSYSSVDTSHEQPYQRVEIDGVEFIVVKVRELVLVPLKAGALRIGRMQAVLRGNGGAYPARGSQLGTAVSSEALTLTVAEPPASGRPPNYQLGDVGRFSLKAQVTPRELRQMDFFSLKLELTGSGNVPASVTLPEVPGIAWGKPTVRGELSVKGRDLAGERTLEFTPQVTSAGHVSLGQLQLPFYDPEARSYRVAVADLGDLEVTAAAPTSPAPAAVTVDQPHSLLTVPAARSSLGSVQTRRHAPPDGVLAAATALPLATLLLTLLPRWLMGLRAWFARGRRRPGHVNLSAARHAAKAGNELELCRELERSTYAILEAKTGLRARAILREHLTQELLAAGLTSELSRELEALLLALDRARSPAIAAETTRGAAGRLPAEALLTLAQSTLAKLARVRSAREPGAP